MGFGVETERSNRLPGFNYNVEEWFEGDRHKTVAIFRQPAFARAALKEAVAEKPAGRSMMPNRTGVVNRHPEGDW